MIPQTAASADPRSAAEDREARTRCRMQPFFPIPAFPALL